MSQLSDRPLTRKVGALLKNDDTFTAMGGLIASAVLGLFFVEKVIPWILHGIGVLMTGIFNFMAPIVLWGLIALGCLAAAWILFRIGRYVYSRYKCFMDRIAWIESRLDRYAEEYEERASRIVYLENELKRHWGSMSSIRSEIRKLKETPEVKAQAALDAVTAQLTDGG